MMKRDFKPVVWCASGLTFTISGLALLGWLFDIESLKSVKSGWVAMRIATLVCLACCAAALLLADQGARWRQRICRSLALIVWLVGAVSLLAYLSALLSGQDPLWDDTRLLSGIFSAPARMAPITAAIFVGFGGALLLLSSSNRRNHAIGHAITLPAALLSYLVLIGYLFDARALNTLMGVPAAMHTGLACCALSLGMFCLRPDTWFMRVFTDEDAGGMIARRLLPAVVFVPILIEWLLLADERAGLVAAPLAMATAAIGNVSVLLLVMWLAARSASRMDQQRRSVEAARRESEELYQALFSNMTEGFAILELITDDAGSPRDCRFLDVNPAFERLTGRKASEIVGKRVSKTMPESGLPWVEAYARAALTGEGEQFESYSAALNRWYAVSTYRPAPRQFAAVFTDITARKRAEEDSREKAARLVELSAALNHAHAMVLTPGGVITYWSRGAAAMYGWRQEEAVGRSAHELLRTEFPAPLHEIRQQLLEHGDWQGELLHLGRDGQTVVVASHWSLQRNQAGQPVAIVEVNNDTTALREAIRAQRKIEEALRSAEADLERRVRERTAQLEAANKELEAFAYSVSHDLRAPLRGIDGWSQALIEDYGGQLDEQARQYLDRVRSETQRMGTLIDDLLQLSRLTRTEMRHEPVDLTSLARNVMNRLKDSQPDRQVEFVIHPGLTATGDAGLLEIALVNLLGNAVKFTGPRATEARVEFGRCECAGEAAFFVRDNGVGFDMAYAGTLFGAFQRLHKVSEFPGTGIGLATVQRVIHRHGGRVWADSQPNRGATFYFTIGRQQ